MSPSGEEIKELGDTTKKHLVSVLKNVIVSHTQIATNFFFFFWGRGGKGRERGKIISEHVSFVSESVLHESAPFVLWKRKILVKFLLPQNIKTIRTYLDILSSEGGN